MNEVLNVQVPKQLPKLTMWDRCDNKGVRDQKVNKHHEDYPGCQERAYVLVLFSTGFDLAFCKHHFEWNELALLQAGAVVVDDNRADLEVQPGVSAASLALISSCLAL